MRCGREREKVSKAETRKYYTVSGPGEVQIYKQTRELHRKSKVNSHTQLMVPLSPSQSEFPVAILFLTEQIPQSVAGFAVYLADERQTLQKVCARRLMGNWQQCEQLDNRSIQFAHKSWASPSTDNGYTPGEMSSHAMKKEQKRKESVRAAQEFEPSLQKMPRKLARQRAERETPATSCCCLFSRANKVMMCRAN